LQTGKPRSVLNSIGRGKSYLYITQDGENISIVAYFSVAITSTDFERISKSRKAKVFGGKPGRDTKDYFGGILIAQFARGDAFDSSDINGREMILDAEKIIDQGRYYLPL
jgi:hypothetical protein